MWHGGFEKSGSWIETTNNSSAKYVKRSLQACYIVGSDLVTYVNMLRFS